MRLISADSDHPGRHAAIILDCRRPDRAPRSRAEDAAALRQEGGSVLRCPHAAMRTREAGNRVRGHYLPRRINSWSSGLRRHHLLIEYGRYPASLQPNRHVRLGQTQANGARSILRLVVRVHSGSTTQPLASGDASRGPRSCPCQGHGALFALRARRCLGSRPPLPPDPYGEALCAPTPSGQVLARVKFRADTAGSCWCPRPAPPGPPLSAR